MVDVQFEEEDIGDLKNRFDNQDTGRDMQNKLVKWGIFKNKKQATLALVTLTAVLVLVAFLNFSINIRGGPNFYSEDNPPPPVPFDPRISN